jgi:hypothetical protein
VNQLVCQELLEVRKSLQKKKPAPKKRSVIHLDKISTRFGFSFLSHFARELQKFSRYIVRGFFEMAKSNPLMYVELLFWKTSHDCYELTRVYGTLEREKHVLIMFSCVLVHVTFNL